MTKLFKIALAAAVLATGAAASTGAFAAERAHASGAVHAVAWVDQSQPYGGFDPNSPEGNRAFWDYIGQAGN